MRGKKRKLEIAIHQAGWTGNSRISRDHSDSNFSTTVRFQPPSSTRSGTPARTTFATAFTKHRLPGTPVNRPGNARSLSKLFVARFPAPKCENTLPNYKPCAVAAIKRKRTRLMKLPWNYWNNNTNGKSFQALYYIFCFSLLFFVIYHEISRCEFLCICKFFWS